MIPLYLPNTLLAYFSAEDSFFGELYILHGVAISVCLNGLFSGRGSLGRVIG